MRSVLAFLLLLGGCAAANTEAACRLVPILQARLQTVGRLPFVAATINGAPARLLLDTGATNLLLSEAAVARFGLALQAGRQSPSTSLDASALLPVTAPVTLALGGQALPPVAAVVSPAVTVLSAYPDADGLLGLSAFRGADLDIDLPHRRLAAFEPRNCPDGPSPLPGETVRYRSPALASLLMAVPVKVDGRELSLVVDTRANATSFDQDAVGLTGAELGTGRSITVRTSGPNATTFRAHTFDRVEVAGIVVRGRPFPTGRFPAGFAGLLGTDFLATHRVWMSPRSGTVLFQVGPARPGAAPAG